MISFWRVPQLVNAGPGVFQASFDQYCKGTIRKMIRFWKVPLCAESESPRPALTHIAKGTITKVMKLWRVMNQKNLGMEPSRPALRNTAKQILNRSISFWRVTLVVEPGPGVSSIVKATMKKMLSFWRVPQLVNAGPGIFQASFNQYCKGNHKTK